MDALYCHLDIACPLAPGVGHLLYVGGMIHILLVIAVVVFLVNVIRGRRV